MGFIEKQSWAVLRGVCKKKNEEDDKEVDNVGMALSRLSLAKMTINGIYESRTKSIKSSSSLHPKLLLQNR